MFTGGGLRFHTAVVLLIQQLQLPVSYSWFLPMSWVLDLSILFSIFVCVYICSSSISLHRCYCCLPSTTYHNCLCRGYLILHYPICKFQSLFSFWIACDTPNIEVDTKKQVARHNQPNVYFEVYIHTTNNTPRLLMISCNNIVFTITTALYAGSVYHVLHSYHA